LTSLLIELLMPRPPLPLDDRRKRILIRGLEHRLSQHRDQQQAMSEVLQADLLQLDQIFADSSTELTRRQKQDLDQTVTSWDENREDIWSRRDRATLISLRSEAKQNQELRESHQKQTQQFVKQHQHAREKLDQQYAELKPKPAKQLERYVEGLNSQRQAAEASLDDFRQLMISRSISTPDLPEIAQSNPIKAPASTSEAHETIVELVQEMRKKYEEGRTNFFVRFAGSVWPWLLGLIPGILFAVVLGLFMPAQVFILAGGTLLLLFICPTTLVVSLMPAVRRALLQRYPEVLQASHEIVAIARAGQIMADAQRKQDEARLLRDYQERIKTLDADHARRLAELDEQLKKDQENSFQQHIGARRKASGDSCEAIQQIDCSWKNKTDLLYASHREKTDLALHRHHHQKEAIASKIRELTRNLGYRIQVGTDRARDILSKQQVRLQDRFPAWIDSCWQSGGWLRRNDVTATQIPIGTCDLRIGNEFQTKLSIEFDWLKHGSLVIEADNARREQSSGVLQSVLARAFTTLPMGQLQCTIIDPEGLGRDFAWLMPLADADPRLVGHRVWTQGNQIAEQLLLLAYQTEDIIQQRLRDRYPNLVDYNAEAGPMAEPFRLLVWANFPFGLDEVSWRALCSILASGGRCGIGVLITIDPNHPWPPYVERDKLRQGLSLSIGESIHVIDEVFQQYALTLESPPSAEVLSALIENCKQAAFDAGKIEVPFDSIRTEANAIGQGKSSEDLTIPLGVAGVGRTTHLRLGHGTAQHVLIAGKTGSGKSSLLHTLIVSAAHKYPPDQLRMVLLDFKKGVEFQVYAQTRLAHAEIIGIESRREFGLSAFEYLDRVMQRRGEMFREVGVQDVSGWYRKNADKPMPRILVVVDEFQELFIEDDKVSQQASMLLDRVVRQGRSFGIHVVLASQTIGGSYSLPRTTLAQMAVRIALQCDGSDAMMILGEDNLAATRLRHSGQAIYNDAGGRIESNQPFQVAFIRHQALATELAKIPPSKRPDDPSTNLLGRQIIFEGHRPAIWSNDDIQRGIALASKADSNALKLVLGESLSIEPTITRHFSRQAGRNAMIVSSDEALASNLISTIVRGWSLIKESQQFPDICYLNGARVEDTKSNQIRDWLLEMNRLNRAAVKVNIDSSKTIDEAIASEPELLVDSFDSNIDVVDPRGVDEAIAKLHTELTRRLENSNQSYPSLALIIANLGRLRELRRNEEFSFGSNANDRVATDEAFSKILREGPSVGIFTLCWVDSWGTLSRFIPRQGLRDLEIRMLSQMSANDSNQLIDSSAANKLESHAMIYFDETDGRIVKFRPYQM
jgi:DNA segregation ATPase FtsK/SpoIIIE, S-DNA-T family